MLIYPQLTSGTLAQFPAQKRQKARTVAATSPGGTVWKLADLAAQSTEWQLEYSDLSDAEAAALEQFFIDAEGSVGCFTFTDPLGNLFAQSDSLDHAVWTRGPLLAMSGGSADPLGRNAAWHLVNTGAGSQTLVQTLAVPPEYVYCLSAYVRSSNPSSITMMIGSHRAEHTTTSAWRRTLMTNTGGTGVDPLSFGIELAPQTAVEVFGLQLEAQPAASGYKSTTAGGVYENARFRDDSFQLVGTGPGRNSCTVTIIHEQHL